MLLIKEKTECEEHAARLAHDLSADKQENLPPDSAYRIQIQEAYHITSRFFTFTYP